jgi:hypothetical protein
VAGTTLIGEERMGDGIFLLQEGGLTELASRSFDTEDIFQDLLASHPDLLAGGQINGETPRRWLLVRREMGIPDTLDGTGRWSIDHLFLDQDGVPTLVEVKRSSDTRIRRELVGQMLDYAANAVVYWPVEEIRGRFTSRCEAEGMDPEDQLGAFLDGDRDAATFWDKVKTNLQAGKVRMLFVADVVPPELQRIVEFLNGQMDPAEVLALEIRQYLSGDTRALVPRIIGQTVAARDKKVSARGPAAVWDEATFFARVTEKCEPAVAAAIRQIYDWARQRDGITWGKGQDNPAFGVWHSGVKKNVVHVAADGGFSPVFARLKQFRPFDEDDQRREWLNRWNTIAGIDLPETAIDRSWLGIRLQDVPLPEAIQQIEGSIAWAMDELDRALAD